MGTMKYSLTIDESAPGTAVLASSAEHAAPAKASAFDLVAAQPWAMTPAMLETISSIARRENESPEAVEARLGRPLQNTRTVSMRGDVAVVPVSGPMLRYANMFSRVSGATSLEQLAQDFTAAVDDPAVRAIVLNFDSPGGQASGIAEFAQMVRAAAKPVVAYVDGSAASAAYWIASAADEIVISKTGEVGSIGAVVAIDTGKKSSGAIEIVSSQSPKKRVDVTTDEGRSLIQARIDAFAQVFIEDVARYRGVDVATVLEKFGQGDMRMGESAVTLGMADRVGTLEEVIAGLQSSQPGQANKQHVITSTNGSTKGKRTMNLEELRAAHPDLCAALIAEGQAQGITQGAEQGALAERQRILDVEAQALPGHETLIATLKADGKTTGPMAAVAVLAAERKIAADRGTAVHADAPLPVAHAAAPSAESDAAAAAALPLDERCKAAWDKNAAMRAEYGDNYASYLAYERANASGRVKVLGRRAA